MIAPTPFFSDRGCHIRILNSYLRLEREDHKITLLTYPLGRDLAFINTERIVKMPGYKKTAPGFSFYRPVLDLFLLIRAYRELAPGNFDLIYAHLHEGALIGLLLKKKYNLRVIFDAQGSLTGELTAAGVIKKDGVLAKIVLKVEKYISNNADEIFTSTEGLKDHISKNFAPSGPIKVTEDLPDISLFNRSVKPAELDLPEDKKIVVYLGGLQKYKGIDYLLRSIPNINNDFHFLIMGYPVERIKQVSEELGVTKRITFTGKIPYELAASYLILGDLAVSPKTLESNEANAKIYNYMAMGLKVVCFDSPENRKILGENGIYAREKDSLDLAGKINGTL